MNFNPQSQFVQPRAGQDVRVARIDLSQTTQGDDGKYYRMLDHKDWSKYKTQSDEDIVMESTLTLSIQRKMNLLSGRIPSGKIKGSGYTNAPPQFGTASKSKKIARRTWDAAMTVVGAEGSSSTMIPKEDRSQVEVTEFAKKYAQNMAVIAQLYNEKIRLEKQLFGDAAVKQEELDLPADIWTSINRTEPIGDIMEDGNLTSEPNAASISLKLQESIDQ
jgi:hypothetical protein